MKKEMYLQTIGIFIYIITSIIDRFIMAIPDYVYVPIMVIALSITVIGIIKNKRNK